MDVIACADTNSPSCETCGVKNARYLAQCQVCSKYFCNSLRASTRSHIIQHSYLTSHRYYNFFDGQGWNRYIRCIYCNSRSYYRQTMFQHNDQWMSVCRDHIDDENCGFKEYSGKWYPLVYGDRFHELILPIPEADDIPYDAHLLNMSRHFISNIISYRTEKRRKEVESLGDRRQLYQRFNSFDEYVNRWEYVLLEELKAENQEMNGLLINNIYGEWKSPSTLLLDVNVNDLMRIGQKVRVLISLSKQDVLGINDPNTPIDRSEIIFPKQLPEGNASQMEVNEWIVLSDAVVQNGQLLVRVNDCPSFVKKSTRGFVVQATQLTDIMEKNLELLRSLKHLNTPTCEKEVLSLVLARPEDVKKALSPLNPHGFLAEKALVERFPLLNSSQVIAVQNAVTYPISLVQGPPGTGKTFVSACIINTWLTTMKKNHKSKFPRILVCAPSNVAVDNICDLLLKEGVSFVRYVSRSSEADYSMMSSDDGSSVHRASGKKSVLLLERCYHYLIQSAMKDISSSSRSQKSSKERERECFERVFCSVDVVCMTCQCSVKKMFSSFSFEYVLMDEASQVLEPVGILPLFHHASTVVLVGDHLQLDCVVSERTIDVCSNYSLFERLWDCFFPHVMLDIQYRMHPAISEICRSIIYDGVLQDGLSDRPCVTQFPWPRSHSPLLFWASSNPCSQYETSCVNEGDANHILEVVSRLLDARVLPHQIGIITPYVAQRKIIEGKLRSKLRSHLSVDVSQLLISTVDGFQGKEMDYIIFNTVRSDVFTSFIMNPKRFNVAVTRAKCGLIVISNMDVCMKSDLFDKLLVLFGRRGCIVQGDSIQSLSHVRYVDKNYMMDISV